MTTATLRPRRTKSGGGVRPVRVVGHGQHLPGEPLDNDDLATIFGELPPSLIPEIGVLTRHWVARPGDHEHRTGTSRMAADAARAALTHAGAEPGDVDLLVLSTSSPEYHLPGAATYVLEDLGSPYAATIELRAGCTGFPLALDIARSHLRSGRARTALVVGSEAVSPALLGMLADTAGTPSRMRLRDRLAAYTFGDGAAALLLHCEDQVDHPDLAEQADSAEQPPDDDYRFVQGTLDARLRPGIRIVGGGTATPVHRQAQEGLLRVELDAHGSERHGPAVLAACLARLAAVAGVTVDDVDHVVLPEGDAAYFADQVTAEVVGGADVAGYAAKVRQNLERVGATGSPAVPLALLDSLQRGEIRDGDRLLLLGIEGARYQYAANVLTWPFV